MEEKILKLLKDNRHTHMSGEDISHRLRVTRTAVWKHIQNLRQTGYEIYAQPHLGYRLVGIPDKMLPGEISESLTTPTLGKKVVAYEVTDSTNLRAYTLAEQEYPEGTLVVAEKQSHGRGRLGRRWSSPHRTGIYMSVILRPRIAPSEAGKITLMSSVSVARTIRFLVRQNAMIKWPNDVYIDAEKVCGILTEMSAEQDLVRFVILGIGINVNTEAHNLPKGASSLKLKARKKIERIQFLHRLLSELEFYYKKINSRDFSEIIAQWRNLSMTLGRRISVKWRGVLIEGQAMDVDGNGALIIRDDFGFSHHVTSGDVEIVR